MTIHHAFPSHWGEPTELGGGLPWWTHTVAKFDIDGRQIRWNARQQRKGISAERAREKERHIRLIGFDYWDVSFWTAFLFTVGSVAWLVNGVFLFHHPSSEATDKLVSGIFAMIGGTCFAFGGLCMYWEALNVQHEACFGAAMRKEENKFISALTCGAIKPGGRRTDGQPPFKLIGWKSIRDMSFAANFSQFVGTSVFWISTIALIPSVLPKESNNPGLFTGVVWTPQVVGASFLTLSSILFTLETQHVWWRPEVCDLGWHVGWWNIWGSLGFLLSGAFGYSHAAAGTPLNEWGVNFTTYIGSYSFLLGSYLQLYETLNKD